ncbi:MAG: stage V sporulation protein [Planctomycetota bacterium]|nr:MAG: stage V sporulation protein [Planctomycetota bacterium]
MQITEVRVKLVCRPNDKLRAFCSITLENALVIRDIKIIDGSRGPFVAMPSRKLTDRCPKCGGKNHLRASFCNDCGGRMPAKRKIMTEEGRQKLYADVAHPIHAAGREELAGAILKAFGEELEKSKLPGYKPVELFGDDEAFEEDDYAAAKTDSRPPKVDAPVT